MSDLGKMEVVIGADLSDLQAQLNKAGTATQAFASKVVKGSNQAGQALVNLGRVAQDAPFGFIGIQNNINPLIESFQRLKEESGSTGSALKALAGSLAGPAGLGLAVSLVTSAITLFALHSQGAGKDVEETKKKTDEAAEAVKKYDAAISAASKSIIGQQADLRELNRVLSDTSNNFNTLTQSIVNQALARLLATKKEDLIQKLLDARLKEIDKLNHISNGVREFSADLISKDPVKKAIAENKADLVLLNDQVKALGVEDAFFKIFNPDKAARAKETIKDVIAELGRQLTSIDAIGIALGKDNTTVAKEKISAVTSTIEKLIKDFKVAPDDTIIAKLIGTKNTDLFNGDHVFDNLKDLDLRTQLAPALQESVNKTGPVNIKVPTNVQILISNKPILGPIKDQITKEVAEINAIIQSTLQNAAAAIGESLGNALANDSFKGFFDGILNVLGEGLKQLGKYLIQTYLLVNLLEKIKFSNPLLGVAAGIALVALGSAIKNRISNHKAFADGGFVSGPGTSRSDSIPAFLSNGEFVLSAAAVSRIGLSNLNAMNDGTSVGTVGSVRAGEMKHVLFSVIKGRDIWLSNNREGQARGRNT